MPILAPPGSFAIASFGCFPRRASFDAGNVILNLLMIKSDINRVMWSMTVECVATPLILLSVWLFHKHGERSLWILVAVLLSLSPVGQYTYLLAAIPVLRRCTPSSSEC